MKKKNIALHNFFKVKYFFLLYFCRNLPTPLHYAAMSPALTVSKLSVTSWRKDGRRMSEIYPRRRQCLIMTLWIIHGVLGIDHGPKIQWVTFMRFSLFQNPAAMSLQVDKHFRSLTNMWKFDFLWIWTVPKCTYYLSMKVIVCESPVKSQWIRPNNTNI